MMELLESAIPVIQHALPPSPPDRVHAKDVQGPANGTTHPIAMGCDATPMESSDGRERESLLLDMTAAQIHRTLERLRTQHAQLTSGALLQQYQRQTTFAVENSRPATKVLSVQG